MRDEKTSFSQLHFDIDIPVRVIGWGSSHHHYHGCRPRVFENYAVTTFTKRGGT
jgi:hypothetical protein